MDEFNYNTSSEISASMAKLIGRELFNDEKNGFFVQSLTGSNGEMMTAPWLTGKRILFSITRSFL